MQNKDSMNSAGGIPGRKRAVKPQGGTPPKTIVCELGVGKTLYFNLFEADSDLALMGQTSLKSDILSQGKEAKSHTEKCHVSIIFCQSCSILQGNINKNHNVACPLTTYKR